MPYIVRPLGEISTTYDTATKAAAQAPAGALIVRLAGWTKPHGGTARSVLLSRYGHTSGIGGGHEFGRYAEAVVVAKEEAELTGSTHVVFEIVARAPKPEKRFALRVVTAPLMTREEAEARAAKFAKDGTMTHILEVVEAVEPEIHSLSITIPQSSDRALAEAIERLKPADRAMVREFVSAIARGVSVSLAVYPQEARS